MDKVIGTCSECGGRVTIPEIWMGMFPPIPSCKQCGAVQAQPHGPVIEMQPKQHDGWREVTDWSKPYL